MAAEPNTRTAAPGAEPTAADENFRGALFMAISMAGFVCNDATMKWISGELNLFQIVFLRGLCTIVMIGALAYWRGDLFYRPDRRDARILTLRLFGEVGGTFCFLTALFNMPLANASAILQSLPLVVTLGAALFLGEKVGWRRYTAIFIGFLGVLIIVRPGMEGFNAFALWAVAAVFFVTIRDLSTRSLSRGVPSMFVTLTTAVGVTVTSGLCLPFAEWKPVEAGHFLFLGGAAVLVFIGYLFGIMAMRHGEIGFISPFRYTIMVWAILLGLIVFGEVPDLWTLIGTGIVVGMGIYTFYRERVRHAGILSRVARRR
ncbi:DMT family transporter [Hwanghaeella sp.]|uniref:DMT family transporter n=1 Tax=Hwanghaeella sp. TaxID=2605943 RepID=UPI003CCBF94B